MPKDHSKEGHRLYQKEDLKRLQQILTLKYLDYSLEEIAVYLEQENVNMSTLKPKILLVDDNETNRRVMILMLKTKDITCDWIRLLKRVLKWHPTLT